MSPYRKSYRQLEKTLIIRSETRQILMSKIKSTITSTDVFKLMFYRLLNAELCLSDSIILINYRQDTHTFDYNLIKYLRMSYFDKQNNVYMCYFNDF